MKKSVRLNKEIRSRIVDSVMMQYDVKNPLPKVPVDVAEGALAEAVHSRLYGSIADSIAKIPTSLLNMSSYIRVQMSTGTMCASFPVAANGDQEHRASDTSRFHRATKEEEDQYYAAARELRKLRVKYDEAEKTRRTYKSEVADVINSVNTTAQLLDLWPEVERFIPETVRNPSKISLPAISVANLNEALE